MDNNNNGLIPVAPATALSVLAAGSAAALALARLCPAALALAALPLLLLALLLLLLALLHLLLNPLERWRHRRVPGFSYKAPLGNIPDMAREGMPALALRGAALYGPTFKVWRGTVCQIVTTDPDAARRIACRISARGMGSGGGGDPLGLGVRNRAATGLLLADGERFTMLKRAWQPAFAPASLKAYAPLLTKAAFSAAERLRAKAAPDFTGDAVDVHAVLAGMTMEAVGSCAFGLDWSAFAAPDEAGGGGEQDQQGGGGGKTNGGDGNENENENDDDEALQWRRMGRQLVGSAEELFGTTRMSDASRWALLAMAAPWLTPAARFLARRFPDAPLVRRVKARQELDAAARFLVEHARRGQAEEEEAARAAALAGQGEGDGFAVVSADSKGNSGGGGKNDGSNDTTTTNNKNAKTKPSTASNNNNAKGVTGIAPGSFLASIMRDGRLTSDDVAAQAQTFVLAGYETTLSALSLAVALLARHPAKARALQRAIDEADARRAAKKEAAKKQGNDHGDTGGDSGGDKDDDDEDDDDASIPYARAALDEAMRLYPPGTAIVRAPGALAAGAPPLVLPSRPGQPDVVVPRATRAVQAVLYAVHRSPDAWPRADDYLPERFLPAELGGDPSLRAASPSAFLPFGAGARMCIGHRFALEEAVLALVALFRALEFEAAAAPGAGEGEEGGRGAALPIRTATGITMGPSGGVWCRVSERRRRPAAE